MNKMKALLKKQLTTERLKAAGAGAVLIAVVLMGLLAAVLTLPNLFGIRVFAVATGSMEPAYDVGSLVFSKEVESDEVSVGDCITYRLGQEIITHRVIEINQQEQTFITQGDQNQFEDMPVDFTSLIGKTAGFNLPLLGYFVIWVHHINYGVLIFIAGIPIVVFAIRKFLKLPKKEEKYEAEC